VHCIAMQVLAVASKCRRLGVHVRGREQRRETVPAPSRLRMASIQDFSQRALKWYPHRRRLFLRNRSHALQCSLT